MFLFHSFKNQKYFKNLFYKNFFFKFNNFDFIKIIIKKIYLYKETIQGLSSYFKYHKSLLCILLYIVPKLLRNMSDSLFIFIKKNLEEKKRVNNFKNNTNKKCAGEFIF